MTTASHDVVVVGAGLAGLACARELTSAGLAVRVVEAGDAVGGRVRTDHVDGYTLDRGFQVLNTAYPELRRLVDLDALDLRAFDAEVGVRVDGRRVTLGNPLQKPSTLAAALRLPVGGVRGKTVLGMYAGVCTTWPTDRLRARDDVSAAEAWHDAGIPAELVDGLLRPFFAGVLLEEDLSTSRRFTDLMFRMFARGRSTVPAQGMAALPTYLDGLLPDDTVQLNAPAERVTATGVETVVGLVDARAVVVATDAWTAGRLLPGLGDRPVARGVTTIYHATPVFPEATAMLLLDGDASPIANSIVLSCAAPEYAPAGQALVSTSMVHGSAPDDPDGPDVRRALSRLHGTDTTSWELVATYDLPHALPGMPAPHPMRRPVRVSGEGGTVYVAGDHRDTSSIQGALVSGRRAARAVLTDLKAS